MLEILKDVDSVTEAMMAGDRNFCFYTPEANREIFKVTHNARKNGYKLIRVTTQWVQHTLDRKIKYMRLTFEKK